MLGSFGPGDIAAVVCYVLFSIGIGVWSARGSSSSASSYFLAGKDANPLVTAVSLVSGLTSGISFVGIPGYSYKNGGVMYAMLPGYMLGIAFILLVAIPFFARPELELVTSYEYLGRRFSEPMRKLAAASFLLRMCAYMGFVLYAPALALQTVLGVPVGPSVMVVGTIATLLSMKGGLSAVIWTDFFASLALIAGVMLGIGFAWQGTAGGASGAFSIARANGKLFPPGFADFAPLASFDMWSLCFGFGFNIAAQAGTDQIAVQRYLATADVRAAQLSSLVGNALNMVMLTMLTTLGVALFGYYHSAGRADPLGPASTPRLNSDQVFPHFFVEALPDGAGGLLVSALFATTVSVFSGGINSAVTCFIVDVLEQRPRPSRGDGGGGGAARCREEGGEGASGGAQAAADEDDREVVRLSKKLTLAFGAFAVLLAYLAQFVGQSLSLVTAAASAVCNAPVFGVFLLGMTNERARGADAELAFAVATAFMVYALVATGICPNEQNSAANGGSGGRGAAALPAACDSALLPGRISEWWYGPVGSLLCLAVGTLSSALRPPCALPSAAMGLTWRTRHVRAFQVLPKDDM